MTLVDGLRQCGPLWVPYSPYGKLQTERRRQSGASRHVPFFVGL